MEIVSRATGRLLVAVGTWLLLLPTYLPGIYLPGTHTWQDFDTVVTSIQP